MLRRWIFGVSQLSANALQSEQKKWHAHSEWQQNKKFSFTFKFLIFCWEIFVTSILHRNYYQFQFLFEPLDDLNFLVLIKAIPSPNSLWSELSHILSAEQEGQPFGIFTFVREQHFLWRGWCEVRIVKRQTQSIAAPGSTINMQQDQHMGWWHLISGSQKHYNHNSNSISPRPKMTINRQ